MQDFVSSLTIECFRIEETANPFKAVLMFGMKLAENPVVSNELVERQVHSAFSFIVRLDAAGLSP